MQADNDEDDDSEVISLESDDQDLPDLLGVPDAGQQTTNKFSPLPRNGSSQGTHALQIEVASKTLKTLFGMSGMVEEDLPEKEYEDGERDVNGSTKVPFPAELRNSRVKLVRCQRLGDAEEFSAQFSLAEVHYHSARYMRACKAASMAFEITQRPCESAKAIRLAVKTHLARRNFKTAMHMVEAEQQLAEASQDASARALSFLALADVHLATGRTHRALKVAEQALADFRSIADKEGKASALQLAAKVELRLGSDFPLGSSMHAQKALRHSEEALGLLRELENKKEECDVLVIISRAHLMRHEYEDAHLFAKGASELCELIAYARGAVIALEQLANIMFQAGEEPDMIVIVATQAVELAQHCGDWLGEISARQSVARAYVADGFKNSALEVLDPALNLARKLRSNELIDDILGTMAKVHGLDSDLGLKLLYDEADLAKEANDAHRESAALVRVVGQQLVLGNCETALVMAEQAVQVCENVKDNKAKATALLTVARVHLALKHTTKALDFAERAKKLFQDAGETMEAAAASQFKADIHEHAGAVDKMLDSYAEQGQVYREAGWQDLEASAQLALSQRLSRSLSPKQALTTCKQAVSLYRKTEDREGEAMALLQLAILQFDARQPPAEVLRTARGVRTLFRTLNDSSGEAQALVVIADVHVTQLAFAEAMEASQEALRLCQQVNDKSAESKALQALANVHTVKIELAAETSALPDPKAIEDALFTVAESIAFHQAMAEETLQATALLQISTLHRINQNAEVAVQAAIQAEMLSRRVDNGRIQALAFLRKAEAHLALGEVADALTAASDAQEMFAAMQDENSYKVAIEIMDQAASASLKDPSQAALKDTPLENEVKEETPEMMEMLRGPFFAVGSWDDWANFEELVPGTGENEFEFYGKVNVPKRVGQRCEEFQIVYNRDWTKRFHPAGGGKIEGPDNMHAVNWQVLVPLDCVSLRIIWNPRGARSCQWRFVTASGAEKDPVSTPVSATGGLNKFGVGVQKLLKDSKPENKLTVGAQKLLGTQLAKPLLTSGFQHAQEDLQRSVAAAGSLKSSLSESEEAAVKIEAAEHRRAMLLGTPQIKATTTNVQFNSSLTESEEMIAARDTVAEMRRTNLLNPAPLAPSWSQPDQELRKAQLKAATNQDALNGILKVVRSDWSNIERQAVLRKLSLIGVASPAELKARLQEKGAAGMNTMLRDAGQKPLREDTLNAIHDHCQRTISS